MYRVQHPAGLWHLCTMNWEEYFDYCPTTGVLRWKAERPLHHFVSIKGMRIWHKLYSGKIARSIDSKGHVQVYVNGRHIQAHRIIWEMVNGPIPKGMDIDHINCVKDDNRASNLRLATRSQNKANTGVRSDNKCGLKGVSFYAKSKRWVAQIQVRGVKMHLGYHDTKEEAAAAYKEAAISQYGEFART